MIYRTTKEKLLEARRRREKRRSSGTNEEYLEIFAKECPKDLSDVFPWLEKGTYIKESEYSKSTTFSKGKQAVYVMCSLLQTLLDTAEWQPAFCLYGEPEHDYIIGLDKELYELLGNVVKYTEKLYNFKVKDRVEG